MTAALEDLTGPPTTPADTASPDSHLANNYHPLPVVLTSGEGAWVEDSTGRRYLDLLSGYSALNFGHRHPALVAAARAQLDRLTLVSRAFDHELLAPFADGLAALVGPLLAAPDGVLVLPMNTGAEAVETAIKTVRKWGYEVKGVPADSATIVVAADNFHGRTTTIVSFSTDDDARSGFGPFTPGFRVVPFGDADAIAAAIDETTVAVLLEPVQGEAGVVVPPDDYLPAVRALCDANDVLLVADEIQSGLGRTGTTLACERVGVRPDLVTLGKALGGGVVPVSAVVGRRDVLAVLTPGTHGSTFGGNPLACAVGLAVVELLRTGEHQERAARLGAHLGRRLDAMVSEGLLVTARTVGLWAGVDVDPARGTGRQVSERLLERGVLVKDTHGQTVRIAPPLVITQQDLDHALDELAEVLRDAR
ncbi:ornithine--oxo-acid transaminase [Cellulomonas carbonis]|uniref:ornithine aminotransferase n=1 Tax=Cellulomonas carbonis T26 TaxID=947969 RepID=A0A0A0BQS6_9CELL|nr:ornithine--oxo-acid transaminase [Cellulomonas carbonis]KGM10275.1 ornithine--oxo-acid aminotransferase [Cellulomonas carbonis T26]GGC05698.1 ornithine--oxo-acid transaminase [Cellulomonas carbonis]